MFITRFYRQSNRFSRKLGSCFSKRGNKNELLECLLPCFIDKVIDVGWNEGCFFARRGTKMGVYVYLVPCFTDKVVCFLVMGGNKMRLLALLLPFFEPLCCHFL